MRRLNQLNSTINTSFAQVATEKVEDRLGCGIQFRRAYHYHETSPHGHLSNTVTSLLGPLFFGRLAKTAIYFLVKKILVNTTNFFWPIGDRVNGVPLYN